MRCIQGIYYPRPRSEEVCSRYTKGEGYIYCKLLMVEGNMICCICHLTMVYTILCSLDYVRGCISDIAFLNFELMRLLLLCVAAVFDCKRMSLSILRPPKHPQKISAVKAELKPRQRAFCSRQLETKMMLVLTYDANGQLACYLTALRFWKS